MSARDQANANPLPPGVYLITPAELDAIDLDLWAGLLKFCAAVQWRSKPLNPALLERLRSLCRDSQTPLIINDDIELAKSIDAAGVHLGRHDASIRQARDVLGCEAIIGASCYQDLERARAARQESADYVSFGACFASATKPDAPTLDDIELLAEAVTVLDCPVVAIGGIDISRLDRVLATGVHRPAVCAGVFSQPDPIAALKEMASHPLLQAKTKYSRR